MPFLPSISYKGRPCTQFEFATPLTSYKARLCTMEPPYSNRRVTLYKGRPCIEQCSRGKPKQQQPPYSEGGVLLFLFVQACTRAALVQTDDRARQRSSCSCPRAALVQDRTKHQGRPLSIPKGLPLVFFSFQCSEGSFPSLDLIVLGGVTTADSVHLVASANTEDRPFLNP